MIWRRLIGLLMFSQLAPVPPIGGGGGTRGGHGRWGAPSRGWGGGSSGPPSGRPANPIIGGYSLRPHDPAAPFPASSGYMGPQGGTAWDPYRERDHRRILTRVVRSGSIMDLQLALMQAGLLDGDVDFGHIGSATEAAFETVLTIANQNGMAWQDVLSQLAAGGDAGGGGYGGGGGGAGGGGGTVITLPNRDDLAAAQEDVFMAMTGEAISDDLREHAVDAIMDTLRTQQERQVQKTMGFSGDGVMFQEDAPDPGRLLEEEVERRAPGKVMGKGVRDMAEVWFDGLAGPV